VSLHRKEELSISKTVDSFVTLSKVEYDIVLEWMMSQRILNAQEKITMIGQATYKPNTQLKPYDLYDKRSGILFVASFLQDGEESEDIATKMFYNGDAIWYFLRDLYPKILLQNSLLPLTIVGREIPQYLYNYVDNDRTFDNLVTFVESPRDLKSYYSRARVFIAPQLYGSGIPYKVRNTETRMSQRTSTELSLFFYSSI
jgi:Glycosyl transferases group 1